MLPLLGNLSLVGGLGDLLSQILGQPVANLSGLGGVLQQLLGLVSDRKCYFNIKNLINKNITLKSSFQ
ncbi:UNVERIFIED_CONTAM: hypothetical protein RMT77_019980 [Armadillidium vulgare]